jgi:AcrR family transcriptional regulator
MKDAAPARWHLDMSTEQRRDEILRSVAELLRDRHASSLTMEAIADRLGMTKGNLYYYFRNKRELLYQCHLKGTNDSLRLLEEIAEVRASPGARLRKLITSLVLAVTRDPYGQVMTTDLETLSGPQRRHYVALRDRFEQGVRQLVREGMEQGEFQVRDVKLASFALLGAINAIGTWYDSAGRCSPEEIAEQYAEFLIGGLQPRPSARRDGDRKR